MLYLQHVLSSPLNVLGNLMAMSRPEKQRAQNEHIERALQEFGPGGRVLRPHHSRDSTHAGVDALPSQKLARSSLAESFQVFRLS